MPGQIKRDSVEEALLGEHLDNPDVADGALCDPAREGSLHGDWLRLRSGFATRRDELQVLEDVVLLQYVTYVSQGSALPATTNIF